MFLLALQVGRLFWALLASTGPFGDWQARTPLIPAPQERLALYSAFDPFYRLVPSTAGDGIQQITSLPLQLFGTRVNESSGQGSAIIADESGEQRSYVVGEEVSPGVTLSGVAYDHVTLSRNGVTETLYIDQSSAVTPAEPAAPPAPQEEPASDPGVQRATEPPLSSAALLSGISFAPRMDKGEVTGIVVNAQGPGDIFARAGFKPGDVIAQVNNQPIKSATDLASLRAAIKPGARLSVMVERGSTTLPIALIIPDQK